MKAFLQPAGKDFIHEHHDRNTVLSSVCSLCGIAIIRQADIAQAAAMLGKLRITVEDTMSQKALGGLQIA
jgi:formate dehydrogenase assembly factor FdhD